MLRACISAPLDCVQFSCSCRHDDAGAAEFTGTGTSSDAAAAERTRQLNPGQALPGMSQRMVASRRMAPSPRPCEQPMAAGFSAERPPANGHALGSAIIRSACPEPLYSEAAGRRTSGSSAVRLALRGEGVSKPDSTGGGIDLAAGASANGASSWQLLQEGDQPRLSCRSKKVSAVCGPRNPCLDGQAVV